MKSKLFALSAMMFFEYAIWGSWAVVLSAYLGKPPPGADLSFYLSFSSRQIGSIYSALPLAMFIAPYFFGVLADRHIPAQRILGLCHLFAAVALYFAAGQTEYRALLNCIIFHAIFFAPTLALTNSIALAHVEDAARDFGKIRVWGTIGWIFAGWLLFAWRTWGTNTRGDLFLLASFFAMISGFFSFFLPNTPPSCNAPKLLLLKDVLKLFKDRNFTVLVVINIVISSQCDFYYMLASPFLEGIGFSRSTVPGLMTIAQMAEMAVMAFILPKALPKLGMKKVLLIGAAAWPLRFAIFAFLPHKFASAAALSLHSVCFVFFFAASFIYFDQAAMQHIRATAQAVTASLIWGAARFLSARFTGWIQGLFTVNGFTDYQAIFLIPTLITLVCAAAFAILFSSKNNSKDIPTL